MKKINAWILIFCMICGVISVFPKTTTEVKAAEYPTKGFATKSQLMSSYLSENVPYELNRYYTGYISFGKDAAGTPLLWTITGKDTGISGDNVVLFAPKSIAEEVVFQDSGLTEVLYDVTIGTYPEGKTPYSVAGNHYGASKARKYLLDIMNDNYGKYFSKAEKNLMNTTTLTIPDTKNKSNYILKDTLYLTAKGTAAGGYGNMYVGTHENVPVANSVKDETRDFWLRTPDLQNESYAYYSGNDYEAYSASVATENKVLRPAFNLNLSSVLFASGAEPVTAPLSEKQVPVNQGMRLRLDGRVLLSGEEIVIGDDFIRYSADRGTAVMIQVIGRGCYSKYLTADATNEIISFADVQTELKLAGNLSQYDYRVWLEKTSNSDVTYAKMATELEQISSIEAYLDEPCGGQALDMTPETPTKGIWRAEVTWMDENGHKVSETIAEHDKAYVALVTFSASDAYSFSNSIKVKINDVEMSDIHPEENNSATVAIAHFRTEQGKIEIGRAEDYSGEYDGQEHSIRLEVNTSDVKITYSEDQKVYSEKKPQYTDVGKYDVYYMLEKDGYNQSSGSKTVTITQRPVTITADSQNIVVGKTIDRTKYAISAGRLAVGDEIAAITLTPSTEQLTKDGKISVSGVKIVDANGKDKTANYKIDYIAGKLTIVEDKTVVPSDIQVTKTKRVYELGEALNTDDIVAKVTYTDGHSEEVKDFTTNATELDMKTGGEKKLVVEYTRNGGTVRKEIRITVRIPLKILTQPKAVETQATRTATFQAVAQGTEPIAYQWLVKQGNKGWAIIKGATSSEYTTPALTISDNGNLYKCIIANELESQETEEVKLTVQPIPVEIKTNENLTFSGGDVIDVSKLFIIDKNAGKATYSLATGEEAGTGSGTLTGTSLKVTKSGTFVIRVVTAAQGNYAAGEAELTITLSEDNAMVCIVKGFEGQYDGETHTISVDVAGVKDVEITYSTDEEEDKEYTEEEPEFTDVGEYTIFYKVEADNGKTVTGSETIIIEPRAITITPTEQTLTWNGAFDVTEFDAEAYDITYGELVDGHSINGITLTPMMNLDGNMIMASDAVIVDDDSAADVTENYEITYAEGSLIVEMVEVLLPDDYDEITDEITDTADDWEEEEDDWEEWNNLEVYNGDAKYKIKVTAGGDVKVTYLEPKRENISTAIVPSTVTLSDGTKAKVTAIAPRAFRHCKKLSGVVIGKNVVSIGKKAFYGCENLKKITIKTKKLTKKKVGAKAFSSIYKNVVVNVPKKMLKSYKSVLRKKGISKYATIK